MKNVFGEDESFFVLKLIKEFEIVFLPDENNVPKKREFFFGDKKSIQENLSKKDLSSVKGFFFFGTSLNHFSLLF